MVSKLQLNDGNEVTPFQNNSSHTVTYYRNEDSVGKGLGESGLDRDDVFVTTKYAGGDIYPDQFIQPRIKLCRSLFGPFSSEFSSRCQR